MNEYKIFFSYSRVDASEFSLKLAKDLREKGFNIWIDQLSILPASKWDTEIQKALTVSDCILFIVSATSVTSDNVLDEINYALNNKKKVFPIIIADCEVPYRVSRLQYVDFRHSYEKGLETLEGSLQREQQGGTETDIPISNTTSSHKHEKSFSKKSLFIVGGVVLLLLLGFVIFGGGNSSDELQTWKNAVLADDSASYQKYLEQYPNGAYADSAKEKLDMLVTNQNSDSTKTSISGKMADAEVMDKLILGKTLSGVKEKLGEPDYDISDKDKTDWVYNLANMDVEVTSFDNKSISAVTYNISADSKDTFLLYPQMYDGYTLGTPFTKRNQTGYEYSDSVYWTRLSRDSYIYYYTCEASGGGTQFCAIIGSRDFNNIVFPDDVLHVGPDALKDVYKNVAKAKKTYITVFYDFNGDMLNKMDYGGINYAYRKH